MGLLPPYTREARTMLTDTWKEFEEEYARRSGVSVEWLHKHGRRVEPCDCGDESCNGWQMTHIEPAEKRADAD